MAENESPETLQELLAWIDDQLSEIIKNDDRWPYERYCRIINESHEHVRLLCKQHLPLVPMQKVYVCVGDERTALLRENTVEELQALRNAIASNEIVTAETGSAEPEQPKTLLIGWHDICAAVLSSAGG